MKIQKKGRNKSVLYYLKLFILPETSSKLSQIFKQERERKSSTNFLFLKKVRNTLEIDFEKSILIEN